MLDAQEREKLDRFMFADDSHRYLVSHALVRSVLSLYSGIAPCDWRFSQGPHGRPEIISDSQPRLRFNLTHTNGLAACIVTLDDDCGIDAERLSERHNTLGVAKRLFSAPELEQLVQHEGQDFLEYFYAHWTLREAYVKARGIGLSLLNRQLRFAIEEKEITVKFDAAVDDCESDWYFQLIRPAATHIAALALHRRTDRNKHIRVRQFSFNG